MEIIKPGILIDFMRLRRPAMIASFAAIAISLLSLVFPGPRFGIDFAGGTELQIVFAKNITSAAVRQALVDLGFDQPDVVSVEGSKREYILRVKQVAAHSANEAQT